MTLIRSNYENSYYERYVLNDILVMNTFALDQMLSPFQKGVVVYDKKRIILGINNTPSIWHNIYNVIISIEKASNSYELDALTNNFYKASNQQMYSFFII